MAVLIVIVASVGVIALVFGAVFFIGHEYDAHPWVRSWLDAQARLFGYIGPPPKRDDIPPEYRANAPGWDELDMHNRK